MKRARCKFRVSLVEQTTPDEQSVHLLTQYDPEDPADTKFSQHTPWGNAAFGISNPALAGLFVEGREFYVDFTPVDEAAPNLGTAEYFE